MIGHAGAIGEIWRYPVKSLGGEQLPAVECTRRGIDGDRSWAVRSADGKLGSGKNSRRFQRMPGLLDLASFIDSDGVAWVRFPNGEELRADDPACQAAVGGFVDQSVTIAREGATSHFDDAAIHLLSTASLRWLAEARPALHVDVRRFRPNLLVDIDGATLVEQGWVGRAVQVGACLLRIAKPTERCVMTSMAQQGLPFEPGILKSLTQEAAAILGVYAEVVEPGTIRVGDPVTVA